MTSFRSFLNAGLSALALFTAAPASAADYVIAVPEILARDDATRLHQDLVTFVMDQAAPGDTLRVVNATALDTIATFTIPEGSAASIANLRRRALASALEAWGRFVVTRYVDAPAPDADSAGRILLPQVLTHLATQTYADLPADARDICVLVIGSARYQDPREPDFAMTDGRFPSDGLIVTSQSRSPYGTADRQGQLRGFHVNLLALDETWDSDLHRLRVERLWSLFLQAQGGTLATFTTDPETARDRFITCERKAGRSFDWDNTRTLEAMISAERVAKVSDEVEATLPVAPDPTLTDDPAPATPAVVTPAPRDLVISNEDWLTSDTVYRTEDAPALTEANLKLGIRWGDGGACTDTDLDLYVRSSPARPYLYFGNQTSPDGSFDKDHRSAPDLRNGLEFVEITDLVALADLDVLVNLYEGTCPGGPKGVIRAYVNGSVYEMPFQIAARRGDKGRSPVDGPNWVRIDVRSLFNLD